MCIYIYVYIYMYIYIYVYEGTYTLMRKQSHFDSLPMRTHARTRAIWFLRGKNQISRKEGKDHISWKADGDKNTTMETHTHRANFFAIWFIHGKNQIARKNKMGTNTHTHKGNLILTW